MTDRVYRSAYGVGTKWHWPHTTGSPGTACARLLDPTTARNPIAVDIDDRCTGRGCAARWHTWLRQTAWAARVAEAQALAANT